MRFYQGLLPAVIWDPKVGAPMVEFKNGIFDTDDEKIIERLRADGYLVEEDLEVLKAGGRLEHGGFTDGTSVDGQLPSGKPPVEEPEKFGGQPLTPAGNVVHSDNLPANEETEMATITQAGNIRHGRIGPVTAEDAGHSTVDATEQAQRAAGKRKRKKVDKDSTSDKKTKKKKKSTKKSDSDKSTKKKKVKKSKKTKVSKEK